MAKKKTILSVRLMDAWDKFFNAPTLESFTFRQRARQNKKRQMMRRYRKK